ncbi:unnamed protein product [Macrosiphum euphorbiae]|uniref:Uncharacterized protein n=1 Tax=Macrosiphum euphorbiae TaxID=13131 RepID=A0AAV0VMM6_9HEMI|nr:unnamed protein product [Macrosiphum euphorbiae]
MTICCTERHSAVLLRALDSYNMTQLDSDLSTPQGAYMFGYHGIETIRDALLHGTVTMYALPPLCPSQLAVNRNQTPVNREW